MTSRAEILDLIDNMLTERLGPAKVGRRRDGVIILAGDTEAFAIQALTIDAPPEVDPVDFGPELVEFIRAKATGSNGKDRQHLAHSSTETEPGEETTFYTSENGDTWSLMTDVGGRRFVRHLPTHLSGGQVSLTDVESFRQREPHSPQNQRLEALLAKQASEIGR